MKALRENGQANHSHDGQLRRAPDGRMFKIDEIRMTCEQPRPAAWLFYAKGQVRNQGAEDRDFGHAVGRAPTLKLFLFSLLLRIS